MALSRPGGRFGGPQGDTPGKERKARSGSGYQQGVNVGFGLTGKGGMDDVPVAPKSSVQVGTAPMPEVNGDKGLEGVN